MLKSFWNFSFLSSNFLAIKSKINKTQKVKPAFSRDKKWTLTKEVSKYFNFAEIYIYTRMWN